jgi:hypothetical protein
MRRVLDNESEDDAEEPEKILDAVQGHLSTKTA